MFINDVKRTVFYGWYGLPLSFLSSIWGLYLKYFKNYFSFSISKKLNIDVLIAWLTLASLTALSLGNLYSSTFSPTISFFTFLITSPLFPLISLPIYMLTLILGLFCRSSLFILTYWTCRSLLRLLAIPFFGLRWEIPSFNFFVNTTLQVSKLYVFHNVFSHFVVLLLAAFYTYKNSKPNFDGIQFYKDLKQNVCNGFWFRIPSYYWIMGLWSYIHIGTLGYIICLPTTTVITYTNSLVQLTLPLLIQFASMCAHIITANNALYLIKSAYRCIPTLLNTLTSGYLGSDKPENDNRSDTDRIKGPHSTFKSQSINMVHTRVASKNETTHPDDSVQSNPAIQNTR